jgi:hypothetical protein
MLFMGLSDQFSKYHFASQAKVSLVVVIICLVEGE